jgi:hypothetical protein
MEMTPEHASTAKGILFPSKKGKPGKKRAGQAGPAAARPITPSREAGLTAHDLLLLSEMARRAGGFQQLRDFLDVLGGMG